MIFPHVDMFQKRLTEQRKLEDNSIACVIIVFMFKISKVVFPVYKFYFLFPNRL